MFRSFGIPAVRRRWVPGLNEQLRNELIRDEGFHLNAYQDSVGKWTIGIGHLLGDEKRMERITFDEANALYRWDVDLAVSAAARIFGPMDFDQPRGRALVNMAFNLGPTRLAGFHNFVAAVKAQQWERAGREMEDSAWWKQVGKRAVRLRKMVETNEA